MGTFHNDKSALHGITVVVDTTGEKVYVGRCDDEDNEKVILVDADVHEAGQNGKSKAEYVNRAAKFGVWKKFDHIVIPRGEVASIKRLGEVEPLVAPPKPAPKAEAVTAAAPAPAPTMSNGEKAVVTLTPLAREEVKRLIDVEGKPGLGLRLGVKGGGCSGFTYKLEFDTKKEGDIVIDYGDCKVFLDRKSTIYLRGITLDHQKGLAGKGFVFHNPNATNTCGCGESFAV
jgi:iron-sulfur cluster assembly accessory protein